MNNDIKQIVKNAIAYLESNLDNLLIDADTHITDLSALKGAVKDKYLNTPNYYQGRPISAEDLLKEMGWAKVDMALSWQNPAATDYSDDETYNFESLLAANKYIFDCTQKYPNKFIPAGWTDPKALGLEKALQLVSICVNEFGFPIVKLNPAQNAYPIDSDTVFTVTERIIELGAIPAYHYGADTPYTPPQGLKRLAERFSPHPIIAVHMGGGGSGYIEAEVQYNESREIGLEFPNIKYVLSAKRDTHIESDLITYQLAGEPFNKNIFCASDAPYGRQTWNFGGYRWMFDSLKNGANHLDKRLQENPGVFTNASITNYMGRNFAELAVWGYKSILDKA